MSTPEISPDTPSVPLLAVESLSVGYTDARGDARTPVTPVVHGVSFTIRAGEVVALVGESGSGKSTIAQSVIGLLPETGRITAGSIRLNGTDIAGWPQARLDPLRGAVISLVPQDLGHALNPVRTIGAQIAEVFRLHGWRDRRAVREQVLSLLDRVGLPDPALRYRQYPHELSGGMRQRVLIAMAVALRPALIIADEPTSALDVTVQKRVLDLLDDLRREAGTAVLFVTHDLGIAADRADRVVVLQGGQVQEQGDVRQVLTAPAHAYTARLLADAPAFHGPRPSRPARLYADADVVVDGLVQEFSQRSGWAPFSRTQPFRAVDGVSFRVARGTTHALVGESGSGKTTTIRTLLGFTRPTAGTVQVNGLDLATLRHDQVPALRRSIQLVYQNPYGSLDPRQTIAEIVGEPLRNFDPVPKPERLRQVAALIERVGLPQAVLSRPPRALSGGQRQRVAIARALILKPQVVVLDEAVSALDVTVQAQILSLLDELQRDLGLTYVFVSHDLAVVRQIADTVSVLQGGRVVEDGPVEQVFHAPASAYTRDLLAAIPGRARQAA
ncbi:dipeptide ABC transporter ATP-binding protein [Novispirillum itersonii]|uniref:ABC-type glutathione transport system ATPase component n=1 Tax=Novispirillum itersonii TaxID=189 RepID=A0A7W9ZH68_NOVIT|nr:ABC transporter ATP-binding protein [Novispirillum itersonii]MBB6211403.1 ABC-type glutathione transport system ATPase component [Novispirillum itersonii]